MGAQNYQVGIVGYGPVGAMLANLMGRAGVRTLVVDKTPEIFPKPRAIALDHEILRAFDNIGILEAIQPFLEPFTASEHFGVDGQLIRRIDMAPAPYPMGYVPSQVFLQPPSKRPCAMRWRPTRASMCGLASNSSPRRRTLTA